VQRSTLKRPHMPQFYRAAGGHSDAPGRRDRRWAASGRKRSNRVTAVLAEFTLPATPASFPLSTFAFPKKDSAARPMCARHFARWLLRSSPSVGFFRAVRKHGRPKNPDQRRAWEQSSSEGGDLRVVALDLNGSADAWGSGRRIVLKGITLTGSDRCERRISCDRKAVAFGHRDHSVDPGDLFHVLT
jgi:hypothetical protein